MNELNYISAAASLTILAGIALTIIASVEIMRGRAGSRTFYKSITVGIGCFFFGPSALEFMHLMNTPAANSIVILSHFLNCAGLLATGSLLMGVIAAFEHPHKGLGRYWPNVAAAFRNLAAYARAKARVERSMAEGNDAVTAA